MKYIETGIEGFKLRFAERSDAAIRLYKKWGES